MTHRTIGVKVVGTNADLDRQLAATKKLLDVRQMLTDRLAEVDQFLAVLGVHAMKPPVEVDAIEAQRPFIWIASGRKGGEPCVGGTRVPIETLNDYVLALGDDAALAAYPSVTQADLIEVRRYYRKRFDDAFPYVRIKALNDRAITLGGPGVEAAYIARVETRLIRAGAPEAQLHNCVRLLHDELEFDATSAVIDVKIASWQAYLPQIFGHAPGLE